MKDCKIWTGRDESTKQKLRIELYTRGVKWHDGDCLLDWGGVPNDDAYYIKDNKMIRTFTGREVFEENELEELTVEELFELKGNGNEQE